MSSPIFIKKEYPQFLVALTDVHAEVHCPLTASMDKTPPENYSALVDRIRDMGSSVLFAYAAAIISGPTPIAEHLLLRTVNDLWRCVYEGVLHKESVIIDPAAKMEVLREYVQKFTMPRLREDDKEKLFSLADVLGRELLVAYDRNYARFYSENAIGDALTRLSGGDSMVQLFLVRSTGHMKKLTMRKVFGEENPPLDDEAVRSVIRCFVNLTYLNLSGCGQLTQEAFTGGHRAIESIVLDDTSINIKEFPWSNFPKLKWIMQNNVTWTLTGNIQE